VRTTDIYGLSSAAPPLGPVSPEDHATVAIEHGQLVPMRDGTRLSLDLIRPEAGGAFPVVLVRTPYNKVGSHGDSFYRSLAKRGYIVAVQDVRGRFNSDGVFFAYMDETDDGYDTVEWLAAQPWCDGNVGMAGRSYVGQTQWLAAAAAPPHLKAIVPVCSPPDLFVNEPILNGIFLLPMAEWMVKLGRRTFQTPDFLAELFADHQSYFDAVPIAGVPSAASTTSEWWDEMMRHPTLDGFWRRGSYQHQWDRMRVAALNITGWYDMNFPGAPMNFAGLRAATSDDAIRSAQKLIIGPWPHWVNEHTSLNDVDFGSDAKIELEAYVVRFLDRWLKGRRNGIEHEPPAHVFVMGANEWWAASEWPLPEAEAVPWYLHSRSGANGAAGDGGLSPEPPGTEEPDRYRYDPMDPVFSVWNLRHGPVDDSAPAARADVLCYTSEPLSEPLDVVGPVTLVLHAASSARDTDWHARLVDVHPDGSARFLCHGALRARFRDSLEEPELLEPGMPYCFRFGMDATGNRWLPGHRIRLELTSSWFPRYERNLNTGAPNNFLDSADPVVAAQTVFHEAGRASHLLLPVIRART
jgi:putative CocE/NonD family hydrolase